LYLYPLEQKSDTNISMNGELLLISVKGSPKTDFDQFDSSPVKPDITDIINKMIKEKYQGWSTVEFSFDDGSGKFYRP